MGNAAETDEVRAAGAVLWRATESDVEVALVHRPRYDDWAFPKGKARPGEHLLLTAVREVTEETGMRPVLGRPLKRMFYLAAGRPKRVDYWAATPAPRWAAGLSLNGGAGARTQDGFTAAGQTEFVPNDEVDKLEWLPVDEAMRRLSYERDVALLREFTGVPASTVPYIFLRHASAVEKEGWQGTGLLRPLDEVGRATAWALADLLACFGPARVFSSAAARCVETVLPYSVHTGVPAAAEPAFELNVGGDAQAATRLAELLADGLPMILCGHRETLPSLYAQAVEYFGGQPPTDGALAKGSFSVLHVTRSAGTVALVATEHHDVAPLP
jgi:8-oxo-dGTP pyrophosphatase MutT (NUDIX family)/phosphohistidine phosphatase SixA